jgi:hypothetical protein
MDKPPQSRQKKSAIFLRIERTPSSYFFSTIPNAGF